MYSFRTLVFFIRAPSFYEPSDIGSARTRICSIPANGRTAPEETELYIHIYIYTPVRAYLGTCSLLIRDAPARVIVFVCVYPRSFCAQYFHLIPLYWPPNEFQHFSWLHLRLRLSYVIYNIYNAIIHFSYLHHDFALLS